MIMAPITAPTAPPPPIKRAALGITLRCQKCVAPPTMRPGMLRTSSFLHARKPKYGPPDDSGTPSGVRGLQMDPWTSRGFLAEASLLIPAQPTLGSLILAAGNPGRFGGFYAARAQQGTGTTPIADVLSVSPLLLEKYMQAAEKIATEGGVDGDVIAGVADALVAKIAELPEPARAGGDTAVYAAWRDAASQS